MLEDILNDAALNIASSTYLTILNETMILNIRKLCLIKPFQVFYISNPQSSKADLFRDCRASPKRRHLVWFGVCVCLSMCAFVQVCVRACVRALG